MLKLTACTSPLCSASRSSSAVSVESIPSGFSHTTCLPAASAARSGVEPTMPVTSMPSRRSASTWTTPMKPVPTTAALMSLMSLTPANPPTSGCLDSYRSETILAPDRLSNHVRDKRRAEGTTRRADMPRRLLGAVVLPVPVVLMGLLGDTLSEGVLLVVVRPVGVLERLAVGRALGVALLRGVLSGVGLVGVLLVLVLLLRLGLLRHALAERVLLVRVRAVLVAERRDRIVRVAALVATVLRGRAVGRLAFGLGLARRLVQAVAEAPVLRLEGLPRGVGRAALGAALLLRLALVRLACMGRRGPHWRGECHQRHGQDHNSLHAPPNARQEGRLESYAATAWGRSKRVTAAPIAASQVRAITASAP